MRKEARILYIYDAESASAHAYAQTLRKALAGWDITLSGARLTTLLFEVRKYTVAHLFFPASSRTLSLVKKAAGSAKIVQTILSFPMRQEDFKNLQPADYLIAWCEADRATLRQQLPNNQAEAIPPCVVLPDVNVLQSSSQMRKQFEVGDRTMVVALNDISRKDQFDAYLYIIREYNRNGGFRLIVPQYRTDKQTLMWRERLQTQIVQERLTSTTLLKEEIDIHSLLDSTDVALYLSKERDMQFDFPLRVVEASLIGKPVLRFDVPPYNESVKSFRPEWVCANIEEVVRESKNIRQEMPRLEQLSTELARYSRGLFSLDVVAASHRKLYEKLTTRQNAGVS